MVLSVTAIVRVHMVHLMNAEQLKEATESSTKPSDLGRQSGCSLLVSTPTIAILYYYAAPTIHIQCESKKIPPPLRFSGIFSQTVGNFLSKFYTPVICSYLR